MAMGFGSVGRRLDEQCDDDTVLAADPQQTVEDGGDGVDEDSGATIRPSQGRRRRHKTAPAPKTRASPSEPVSGSPEGESSGGGSGAVGRGGPALEVPSSLTSSYPLLGHLVSPRANPEHPTAPSSTATTPRIDRPPPYTRVSPTSAAGSTLLPGGGVPMDEPPPYPSDSTTLGPRPLRYPLTQRPPPSTVPATDPPAYTAFASPTATAASPVAPSASSRSLRQPSLSSAHPLPGMPRSSLSSLGTSSAASPSPSSAFPTTATVRRRATSDSDSAASPAAAAGPSDQSAAEGGPTCKPGLLQPRLAVVLGLPPQWHPVLFGGRLLSLVPALWWGVPAVLRVAVEAYLLAWVALLEGWGGQKGAPGAGTADGGSGSNGAEARRLVPALLDGGAGRQAVFGGSVADDGFAAWTAYVNLLRQMGDLDPALVLTDGFDRRRFLTARGLRVLASGLGVVWVGTLTKHLICLAFFERG